MTKILYVLIGPQGSGKTHWCRNILLKAHPSIVRVSQDDQGRVGHRDMFNHCLDKGLSMVVDRMNFNKEHRRRYIQPAKIAGYHVVYVQFETKKETCLQRLATRKDHPTIRKEDNHEKIIQFFFDSFEEPSGDEFDELLRIRDRKIATTLDIQNVCDNKKVIIVGDIHGHFEKFSELLIKCDHRQEDIVVSVGDLVDRGPSSDKVLHWFRSNPSAYVCQGNHDNKLMRWMKGNPVKIANGLDQTIKQCQSFDFDSWSAWIELMPDMIIIRGIDNEPSIVVHAGIDGRIPVFCQRKETCMYARRLDGKDFFDEVGGIPWWDTLTSLPYVFSGHISTDIVHPNRFSCCLDGGVASGGKLRAAIIDDQSFQKVEV